MNQQSKKHCAILLVTLHLIATLLINLFLGNYTGFLGFLGAVAYTIGVSIIVLISFPLLFSKKINKLGTYISISLQILGSIGLYCSTFAYYYDSFFILGLLCGIVSNVLYISAMGVLLKYNINSCNSNIQPINTHNPTHTEITFSKIKFCRKCGNSLISGSKFCNKCGTKVDWREH